MPDDADSFSCFKDVLHGGNLGFVGDCCSSPAFAEDARLPFPLLKMLIPCLALLPVLAVCLIWLEVAGGFLT